METSEIPFVVKDGYLETMCPYMRWMVGSMNCRNCSCFKGIHEFMRIVQCSKKWREEQ